MRTSLRSRRNHPATGIGPLPLFSALLFAGACAQVPVEPEEPPTPREPAEMEADIDDEPEAEARPERPEPPFEMVEGEPMYTVLPVDAIPAIDEPVFVSLLEAASFMSDDEPVLGIVGADGTAKCYSAWHLEEHEIVNDQLDGAAIAVTW